MIAAGAMETIRAVRLAAEAERRLRRATGSGRVVAAYARTVNLELDGAGWLSLHAPGSIPAPFGIACEPWRTPSRLDGASVRVMPDALVLDGRLWIRWDGAAISETTLPTPTPLPPVSRCLAQALARITAGLLPVAAALLTGGVPPTDPLARAAVPALARLSAATTLRAPDGCLAAARPLLGLGPGLTPAGDDCLVGWLAGARTASSEGRALAEAVGPGLLGAATRRTGPLSRAFLAAAVAGEAAEPLRDFVLVPDEARLEGLLALGATSGADLLAGYLLARVALGPSEGGSAPLPKPPPQNCAGEARARSGPPSPDYS